MGYSPWGCKESDTTEQLTHTLTTSLEKTLMPGKTDTKAETPILWPTNVKSLLIGKFSDAGRNWAQEEKGMTEDEMASLTRWT